MLATSHVKAAARPADSRRCFGCASITNAAATRVPPARNSLVRCTPDKVDAVGDAQIARRSFGGALLGAAGASMTAIASPADAKDLSPDVYESLSTVKKVMKALSKGDYGKVVEMSADNCKVVRLGPAGKLPYYGKFLGQTAVADYFAAFEKCFTITKIPETLYYLGETNAIFVALDYEYAVVGAPGATMDTSVAMKVVITDGKLTKMAIIADTLSEYLTLLEAGMISA